MSLVTDAVLEELWREAQRKKSQEWASVEFWNHLYSKYIFPGKEWIISPQLPPEGEGLRRVDLVIKYVTEDARLRILIFHEQKPHDASPDEIETSEFQAFDASMRYLTSMPEIEFIYSVTSCGTMARAWRCERTDHYLQPLFGDQRLAEKKEYVKRTRVRRRIFERLSTV